MAFLTRTGPHCLFSWLYWCCATICCLISLWTSSTIAALTIIIVFGLPHGALDGEMARQMLRPDFGWRWFPLFALPYLLLILLVLICWRVFPLVTLSCFLALSLWHFGCEAQEKERSLTALIVLGGAPLILPCVFQPQASAALLSAMASPAMLTAPPAWLVWLFPLWCFSASAWLGAASSNGQLKKLLVICGLIALFASLPPIQAFTIYFVFLHAPIHVSALIRNPRWTRITSEATAMRHALPLTIATLAIGAALYPFHTGGLEARLLTLTFQLLAALTLPHMVFDFIVGRQKAALPL